MTPKQVTDDISEEEELRLALEAEGRIHDCVEAGCELNPQGEKIKAGGKPQRRPKRSKRIKALLRKYQRKERP